MKLEQLWQRHVLNLLFAWAIISFLFHTGWLIFGIGILIWILLFYFTAPGVFWSYIFELSPAAQKDLKLLEKAVSMKPLLSSPYLRLGVLYARQKDWAKAIMMMEQALNFTTPKGVPSIKPVLGVAYRENGEYEKAQSCFESLIEQGVRTVHVYINLAQTYIKVDKLSEALEAAQKARSLDTSSISPVLLMGKVHFLMKDFQAAKDDYEWAISHASWPVESYYWLGRIEFELGENDKAAEHLQTAVQRITDDPDLSDVPADEAKKWLEQVPPVVTEAPPAVS